MAAFSRFSALRGEYPERTARRVCSTHGDFAVREYMDAAGTVIGELPASCPACCEEHATAAQRRQRAEQIAAGIAEAKIPPRFVHVRLDDMHVDEANRTAVGTVRDYARRWPAQRRTGESLILLGPVGTGKTHAGVGLLRHAIEAGSGARYVTVAEMLGEVRDSWNRRGGASEKDILGHFAGVSLLMLDEIGATAGSDHERATVFDVLDRRYRAMAPTVLAGNTTIAELERVLDARAVDRLREAGRAVLFSGLSRRARVSA